MSGLKQQNYQRHIVGIHYVLGSKIGEGSFGVIFEGENILNDNSRDPVAIKFEPRNSDAPQLRDEFRAYRILNGCIGIPHAYYYGQEGMHNVLVIDLLGPSLEDLFEWCGRKFSIKTTCLIAKQMISRIKEIHEHDLIYRDIKPDNFLISEFQLANNNVKQITKNAHENPNLIYMVDFGMAKQYRDPRTKQHIPYRERKSLSGTARYMSINTHFGREQSRRDDLESLGHVFFYFLRGSLPWQGLKAPNSKLKYEKIGHTKQKIHPNELLLNNSLPRQFATFLAYARGLKFDEKPNYEYLLQLMDDVLADYNLVDDGHYDWMDLNKGQGWDINVNKRSNLHGYGNPTPRHNNRNKANTNDIRMDVNSPYNRIHDNPNKCQLSSTVQDLNSGLNNNTKQRNRYHSSSNDLKRSQQIAIKSSSKTYDSIPQNKPFKKVHNNMPNSNSNLLINQRYDSDNYVRNDDNSTVTSQEGYCYDLLCCFRN